MVKVMGRTKYHIGKWLIRFNAGLFGVSSLNFSTERLYVFSFAESYNSCSVSVTFLEPVYNCFEHCYHSLMQGGGFSRPP
jgi:hypothetical protein